MTEILGAVAAVDGLVKGIIGLYNLVHDIRHADEERLQLENVIRGPGGLEGQLLVLKKRADQADKGDPEQQALFSTLLSLRNKPPPLSDDKLADLLPTDELVPLTFLKDAIVRMSKELEERQGFRGKMRRLKWTKDKHDVKSLLDEIETWKGQLDFALRNDHLSVSLANHALLKEAREDTRALVIQDEENAALLKEGREDTKALVFQSEVTHDILKQGQAETHALVVQGHENHALLEEGRADTKTLVVQSQENATALQENKANTKAMLIQGEGIEDTLLRLEIKNEERDQRDAQRDLREIQRDEQTKKEKEIKLYTDIADWLSLLDFNQRHGELLASENLINMSNDLVKSEEFQAWREGRQWILSCWANAGAGKTILSSMVVEHLRDHFKEEGVPVLCLYLNHKEHGLHTTNNLIGALLKQLIMYNSGSPFASDNLVDLYQKTPGKTLKPEAKLAALCEEIQQYGRIIIVIDGLDEASQTVKQRWSNNLVPQLPLDRLSVMTTSRDVEPERALGMQCDRCGRKPINIYYKCDICPFYMCYTCFSKGEICKNKDHVLAEDYEGEEVYLNITPSENLIAAYVKNEIHKEVEAGRSLRQKDNLYKEPVGTNFLGRACRRSEGFEEFVVDTIVARASGNFLFAKRDVDAIKLKRTKEKITEALRKPPKGYADVYDQAMTRIKQRQDVDEDDFELAVSALSWIVHAHRPLMVDELLHAMAIGPSENFDSDAVTDRETLLDVTNGLLSINNDIVRLPHYTAQEYFEKEGQKWFTFDVEAHITCSSLQYLDSPALSQPLPRKDAAEEYRRRKEDFPFLAYAYEYWGLHAKAAGTDKETSERVGAFLRNEAKVAVFVQALWYTESAEASRWEIRKGASALHVAAWFGLAGAIPMLVKMEELDVNSADPGLEQTPLIYAARRGHADAVKVLLEQGADVNQGSAYGNTPLFEALDGKHYEVAELLLHEDGLDINHRYFWKTGRTILIEAARRDSSLLNLIMDTRAEDLDVNVVDNDGHSALALACAIGHENVVAQLLKHENIQVNIASETGHTPLSLAAVCDDESCGAKIVSQLLKNGADPNVKDKEGGGTPVIRAVDEGHPLVLRTFLDHDESLKGQKDGGGRGILHAAAVAGHIEITTLAISLGIAVNVRDKLSRTPLHDAARFGSEEMITLLLSYDAPNDCTDVSGRRPWEVAWQNGHTSIIHHLNPSVSSTDPSSSPLLDPSTLPIWSLCAQSELETLTHLALTSPSLFTSPSSDPDTGNSPLHSALLSPAPQETLSLLLTTNIPLSPLPTNDQRRTPLHLAALSPSLTLMSTLLSNIPLSSSILDTHDAFACSPLYLADRFSNAHPACLLLEAGASIEPRHRASILPLFFTAIEYGYLEAVKRLVDEYGGTQLVSAKNSVGESPQTVARANGWKAVERWLVGVRTMTVKAGVGEEERTEQDGDGERAGGKWKVPFPRPEDIDGDEDEESEGEGLEVDKESLRVAVAA